MGQLEYFKAKYQKLEDLPGVGDATAQKLKGLGFRTVESIATADPTELQEIGPELSRNIIEAARKAFGVQYMTGAELMEMRKNKRRCTTGSGNLDKLLEGGLETQSITEFYGEFGSGKSQFCHQAAITVQLPEEMGGLDGAALYIDTEQVFYPSRCLQIAKRWPILDLDEVLKRIIIAQAFTSEHQMALLAGADEIIKEHGVRIIIVDSLTSNFRSEYIGRENLAPRQQQLNKHMHKLMRLARAFNAVAVVTNQVTADPTPFSGFEPRPIGGNIVGHIAHTRISIRKTREPGRIMKIVASPFLPVSEMPLILDELGFHDPGDKPKEQNTSG